MLRPPSVVSVELEDMVRQFSLRSTSAKINPKMSSRQVADLLASRTGSSVSSPAVEMLSLQDGSVESQESTVDSMISSSSETKPQGLVEANVAKHKLLQASLRQAGAPQKKNVAETLAELKEAFKDNKAESTKKPKDEQHEEAEKEMPPKKKRKKNPTKKAVKPAASATQRATSKVPREPKVEEKNKPAPATGKSVKQIPNKVSDPRPLKMDRKNVASRAYHRVLSQKLQEMDHVSAKCEARKAHQAALLEWDKQHGTSV